MNSGADRQSQASPSVSLFVRQQVADYDAWRRIYDDFADINDSLGVRSRAVHQSVDDPCDVTVWHRFDDLETARAFISAPELLEALADAGVQGEPEIWFTQEL